MDGERRPEFLPISGACRIPLLFSYVIAGLKKLGTDDDIIVKPPDTLGPLSQALPFVPHVWIFSS